MGILLRKKGDGAVYLGPDTWLSGHTMGQPRCFYKWHVIFLLILKIMW